jgi:hypothetical protein
MVTVWCACPGWCSGAPAEGLPTAEEGSHGGHQRSEGMAPGKARVAGADSRWPARVRGGAGPSGWRSPAVRGYGDPLAALGGSPTVRDRGERRVLVVWSERRKGCGKRRAKTGAAPF